ncbi:MAG TPA: hypothetical protein VIV11_04735 [Kofleriaceae bacterium]
MRWWLAIALVAGCGDDDSGSGMGGPRPVNADELARACVSFAACMPGATLENCLDFVGDVESYVSVYRPYQVQCLDAAGPDCTRALRCVGLSLVTTCTTPGVSCDDSKLVECTASGGIAVECNGGLWHRPGGSCIPTATPRCGFGTCTATGTRMCNGTRVETCWNDTALTVFECGVLGETCVTTASGQVQCGTVDAPTCAGTGCQGDVLIHCDTQQHRIPCPSLFVGGTCVESFGQCGFADECTPGDNACTGDVLSVCAVGKPVTVDCKQLGYASCSVDHCVAL